MNHIVSQFFVGHFTAAVKDLDSHFMSFAQKLADLSEFDFQISRADLKPEAHLLEFTLLVAATVFLSFFHLLVLIFAPVDDFRYRWIGVWRNFNEIEPGVSGGFESVGSTYDAKLFTLFANYPKFGGSYRFVDTN